MTTTSNKIRTNVYLDANNKIKAQEIFKQYGIGLSEAFNIFLTQSILERGIPFEIKIPNEKTIETIKDAKSNKNMTKVSLTDLKKDLGAWFISTKDLKKAHLNPTNSAKLFLYISLIVNEEELPVQARDHFLSGEYKDTKEFHISGDLLVIYMITNNTLNLLRLGTHSQLFK